MKPQLIHPLRLAAARAVVLRSAFVFFVMVSAHAQIPKPGDAPKPLSPAESAKQFRLPPGFTMKLLAAEPLITEPSGVCWDEHGRLFVSELHGYNVEGHYDIEELNKTGRLDTEVRRIQASPEAKRRAEKDIYGTVKLLLDRDGDGRMDDAIVWADHLPPCYGLAPARGGIIVACAPDIWFFKDTDGDGKPDVREKLFTGFEVTLIERAISNPQWGVDNWIYFGAGPGGTITGPHLKAPVKLGRTDFRIRSDGSAIEPVEGGTKTIGLAITEDGDRFTATTTHPGLFVTPLPWRYQGRNPDGGSPAMDAPASDYQNVFPVAPPHPWRTKRAQHADYFDFYKRISLSDAAADGWFTSGCSPLVYQDDALPGLRGHYLMCEPAQNFVHLAAIERDQTRLRLKRTPADAKNEFLASADIWFHAIALSHAPDGAVAVTDFYREIIEDYSAIPRHLQQQYSLLNGRDHGRLWRLTHRDMPAALPADMTKLAPAALVKELASPRFWRRQTARRLLIEGAVRETAPAVQTLLASAKSDPAVALGALYTLEGWGALRAGDLLAAWRHPAPEVKRHALRLADTHFGDIGKAVEEQLLAAGSLTSADPRVALQAALSLGESRDPRAVEALANLARTHGDVRWLDAAIVSSARAREHDIVVKLIPQPGRSRPALQTLVGAIAARGNLRELELTRTELGKLADADTRAFLDNLIALGIADAQPLPPGPAPEAVRLDPPSREELVALEKLVPRFTAALGKPRDPQRGGDLFREHCAACHRARGLGVSVGPDLDAEFQRAEDVILRDILFPSETIRPGFETWLVQTRRGGTISGVLAGESPTSITLRVVSGLEVTYLRKKLFRSGVQKASLMPGTFAHVLEPGDAADLIAFLRQKPVAQTTATPLKVSLWPGRAPVGGGAYETTDAELKVYLPPPDKATGAAVVICPGGGYIRHVVDREGYPIASWLNEHGIAAVLLTYRLPEGRSHVPLLDAQRAVRITRANAGPWKIDPGHIGILGFSAGGHVASTAGTHFDAGRPGDADPVERLSCRPDFMLLVYPVVTMGAQTHALSKKKLLGEDPAPELVRLFSNETQVTDQTPPAFIAHAADDRPVPPDNSRNLVAAMKAHHVPVEYLELPSGGHGLNGCQGPLWEEWKAKSLVWLAARKMIPQINR